MCICLEVITCQNSVFMEPRLNSVLIDVVCQPSGDTGCSPTKLDCLDVKMTIYEYNVELQKKWGQGL